MTGAVASLNQPSTSTTTWTEPAPFKIETLPCEPTPTTTRLAAVSPVRKLTLEVKAKGVPLGRTASQLGAVPPVAVRLSTTAETPPAGTPLSPVTCRSTDCPAPTGPASPLPDLLSARRAGVSGW